MFTASTLNTSPGPDAMTSNIRLICESVATKVACHVFQTPGPLPSFASTVIRPMDSIQTPQKPAPPGVIYVAKERVYVLRLTRENISCSNLAWANWNPLFILGLTWSNSNADWLL